MLFELVGGDVKGGFRSEEELREHLYSDHVLYCLKQGKKASLAPFTWLGEEAVCIPAELTSAFNIL